MDYVQVVQFFFVGFVDEFGECIVCFVVLYFVQVDLCLYDLCIVFQFVYDVVVDVGVVVIQ